MSEPVTPYTAHHGFSGLTGLDGELSALEAALLVAAPAYIQHNIVGTRSSGIFCGNLRYGVTVRSDDQPAAVGRHRFKFQCEYGCKSQGVVNVFASEHTEPEAIAAAAGYAVLHAGLVAQSAEHTLHGGSRLHNRPDGGTSGYGKTGFLEYVDNLGRGERRVQTLHKAYGTGHYRR